MTRPRVNAAALVPETGAARASANVIVTWDAETPLTDIEEAIKAAARQAVVRVREETRFGTARVAAARGEQLVLPEP